MDLNNNGGPQRGMIMEQLTPADFKNEPCASFRSAFFQGPYLPGEAARSMPIYCTSLAAFLRADFSPRGTKAPGFVCVEDQSVCRGTMEEII